MSNSFFMRRLMSLHGAVPNTDGMGYVTSHIEGGAGFSYQRHSRKELVNGRAILKHEYVPSPLDANGTIRDRFSVWLGQTADGENGPCPFPVPTGAVAEPWCPDAEVDWFAEFGDDGAAAEAFAASLPFYAEEPVSA